MEHDHWTKFGLMILLSFIAMYALMYLMVNSGSDLFLSINQAYMAASMTAAMVIIELVIMGSMYKNATLRLGLIGLGAVVLALAIGFTRNQTAISNKDFLRSMIVHHSGALLMCQNENLTDPEIKSLCQNILESQQSQIDFMKERLDQGK